jgi:hypothetical protein
MACGQRRMVGRNSSITDRLWSIGQQALQTMTVNGRSVPRREEVNVPCSGRPRRSHSQVVSFSGPFSLSYWYLFAHNMFSVAGSLSGVGQ